MMKFRGAAGIITILIILFLWASCARQDVVWNGTIEEINGVKVVKNPREPLHGELVFDLEEDLSIGNESDDNYLFYRIADIQVDNTGNIYVLEYGNTRVQKFDSLGNYVCTIGKKGQGPGEFQRPSQVLIDEKNGSIGVRDTMKLVLFDKDGEYLDRDISFEEFYYNLVVDSAGFLWGLKFIQEGEDEVEADMFKALGRLTNLTKIDEIVAKHPYHFYRERLDSGAVLSRSSGFEHDLYFSLVDDQNLVYGYSKDYELTIIDLDGILKLKITKDEPTQSFTSQEMQKLRKLEIPEYKPYFYAFFSDSEGRIYVQRNNLRKIQTEAKIFDVFSNEGYYLYHTVCQLTPYVIRNGFYYTRTQNEETGEVLVKRLRIRNWDQLKTGLE